MCNKNQAIKILEEVYTHCNQIYQNQICDAILYGSFARGDYHSESDVDIFLTVKFTDSELVQYRKRLTAFVSEISLLHDVTVSVVVNSQEKFHQYREVSPYYQNILREGIRIAQ